MNSENTNISVPRRTKKSHRRGASAIEAAIVMPVLILVTLGGIDIAQYVNLAQLVSNSSREGARIAARNTSTSVSEVEDAIVDYIKDWYPNISDEDLDNALSIQVRQGDDTAIANGDLTTVTSGDPLRVDVSFDFDMIRWLSGPEYTAGNTKQTTTYSRRE